jgi:hypothetical protein
MSADQKAFLESLRIRIQLYSPAPVRTAPHMTLVVKDSRGELEIDAQRLYDLCQASGERCQVEMDKAVQSAARQLAPIDAVPDHVFAGLKEWTVIPGMSVSDSVLSFTVTTYRPMLERRISGMLWETCFVDETRQQAEISEDDADKIASSERAAFALCEKNLAAKLGPMTDAYSVLGPDNIGMVQGSPYESARILLVDQWHALASKWGGHILVSMPLSSVVIFTPDISEQGAQALLARSKAIAATSSDLMAYDVYELESSGWDERTHEARNKMRFYQTQ